MAATMVLHPKDDDYTNLKSLNHDVDFLDIQQDYVKEEQKNLKHEELRSQEDVKRIQSVPLEIGQFLEMIDDNYGIVGSSNGHTYYVKVSSTVNREMLKPSASVALHKHSHALVEVLPPEADSGVSLLSQSEKPDVTFPWAGCHGPRMVRDVFRLAKENAPAIIFIDEVDAIATARFDAQTGSDREVQRILMELLNQMDGFDQTVNVKVIMATNRADTLDPALLRPGRLDRKIEFPLPDRRQKRLVFQVCTAKMNLGDEVDLEDYVSRPDKISAAEISAICQEAGMHAVRKNRYVILPKDFEKGYRTNEKKPDTDFDFYN
ncbi:26S proteasome regulatory subunit 6B-like protein [Tanacetum coccineum]